MKKFSLFAACAMFTFALSSLFYAEASTEDAATDKEITFRGFPWGTTTYKEVNEGYIATDTHTLTLSGENYKKYPVDEVLYDNGSGIDLKYGNINVIYHAYIDDAVAGYEVDGAVFYFVRPVDENGVLDMDDEDSILYGGSYEFETVNAKDMAADLLGKLTLLYGEPDETRDSTGWYGSKITYTHWSGANNTELGMKVIDASTSTSSTDESCIYLGYAWRNGDNMLKAADDAMAQIKLNEEAALYGNDDTSGL